MKAKIRLANEMLVAELDDFRQLVHEDAIELAELLWKNGVAASDVTTVDWHQDAQAAPTGGQKVAIYSRLRVLENCARPDMERMPNSALKL